ncbi:metabotropic glutamate receptor 1-like [Patiria miniata]|uniref:G-protein coupled receptors family 3 profile domain-containing protein n=1 Tax=Patiria miniata TaxID=46514 RepID=A0A913Z5D6_PATMI|nr:metabotropic glutamate receptor 1-like [Patiria miniata]
MAFLTLCILFLMAAGPSAGGSIPDAAHVSLTSPGDVILGASLPMHGWFSGSGPPCSGSLGRWGNEVAALLRFAIEEINNRTDLLPNVTIGYDIRDNCYSETLSVWTALSLASTSERPQEDVEFTKISPAEYGNLFCIIGTQSSATTIPTAQAASLYRIPVISPFATSNELSDKRRFPYFLRTVPPDSLQAKAIADILLQFGWKYVGLYFQLNTYGIHGAQALLDLAELHGICVAFSVPVRSPGTKAELYDAVSRLAAFPKARVVVIISEVTAAGSIVRTIEELFGIPHNITFVGSDAWAFPSTMHANHGVDLRGLQGSIYVQLKYNQIPGFEEYFRYIETRDVTFSSWFQGFKDKWMKDNQCSDIALCPIRIAANDNFLVDAVYAFAYGLQDLLRDRCNDTTDCNSTIQAIRGQDFLPYLLGLRFQGLAGKYVFDVNGNPGGKYKILNYQFQDDVFQVVRLGEWEASEDRRLDVNLSAIQWVGGSRDPPASLCREICTSGHIEVPLEEKCCFGCQQCPNNAIVQNNLCEQCPVDEWPDASFQVCRPIVPTPPSWSEPTVVSILILSGLGLVLSLLAALGLFHYRHHVLIKAASRELSSINILGLTLAFLAPFPLLVPPTAVSCRASEIIVALCFTLTYAPTLLKVNRIYRIFDAGKKSNKPPRFMGPRSQLTIVLGVFAAMVVVAVAGTLASPTLPAKLIFYPPADYIEAFCKFGNGFLASLICNLLIVLVCCYYAFKARKVPSNYNESKFIAISVYSTLVFGMAAVPVYITAATVLQKVATLCVAILLNSFLTLFCVYLPKLYAIQLARDVQVSEWRANDKSSSGTGSTGVQSTVGTIKVQPVSGAVGIK